MVNSQFDKFGHIGRWNTAVTITAQTSNDNLRFDGKDFGAAGVIRGNGTTGYIVLSGGGKIDLEDLDAGIVHEFGVVEVKNIDNGNLYILKK